MSLDSAIPQEEIIDVFKGKRDRSKNLKKKQKVTKDDSDIELVN
jgi:hypothetical protein